MKIATDFEREMHPMLPTYLGIALVCLVAFVYSATLGADFVWGDDTVNIYDNPNIRSIDGKGLVWMFSNHDYARRYMPLAWLSWAIDNQVFGGNPLGFHLGNLLLHAANSCLVFIFLFVLLRGRAGEGASSDKMTWWCAAVGAGLWAMHPMRVEPVAWASGMIYCQATFFLLISWLAYLKSWPSDAGARRKRWFFLSLVCYASSLLTYPIALGGAIVFFFLDWHLGRKPAHRSSPLIIPWSQGLPFLWRDKWPFFLVTILILGVTLWARVETSVYAAPPTLQEFPILDRAMQSVYMWAYYLWRPWWPVDLAPYYMNLVEFNPLSGKFVASLIAVGVLTVGLVWKRRVWRGALFVWIAYLVMMVPLLGLTEQPHHPNDRYNYIVDIGMAALVAWALLKVGSRSGSMRPCFAVATGLLLVFSWMSMQQTTHWRDTVSHYDHALSKLADGPLRAKLMMGLGVFYQEQNDLENATDTYLEVLRMKPEEVQGRSNLGDVYAGLGHWDESERYYREALSYKPSYLSARLNLGVSLARQGRLEEARVELEKLLQYHPTDKRIYHNLGLTLKQLGRGEEAEILRQKAIRLEQDEARNVIPIVNRH